MNALISGTAAGTGAAVPLARITVDQYHTMLDSGALREGAPIELLDGVLVLKDRRDCGGDVMTVGSVHASLTKRLRKLLEPLAEADGCVYRREDPVAIPEVDEPEPDGVVAVGTDDDFVPRHPRPDEVRLVIEVAWSSLSHDLGTKQRVYATAGIGTYWVLDAHSEVLVVMTGPDPAAGTYRSRVTLTAADTVRVPLPGGAVDLPLTSLLG